MILIVAFCIPVYSIWLKRIGFLILHTVLLALGYYRWPRLSISQTSANFKNKNDSFRFRVANDTEKDVYSVSSVMRPGGVGTDQPFNIKMQSEPKAPTTNGMYPPKIGGAICTDVDGKQVILPYIDHLAPHQNRYFTIIYGGDAAVTLVAEEPKGFNDQIASQVQAMDESTV